MLRIAFIIFVVVALSAPEAGASYIGVQIRDFTSTTEPHTGVKVTGVKQGGPADRSGMKPEDILVDANGIKLTSAKTLVDLVGSVKPGDPLKVRVWRRGSYVTLTVVSAELPQSLVHVEQGKKLYDRRELDDAIQEFNKALTFDPSETGAYLGRAWAFFGKKDYDRAIDDTNRILGGGPNAEALLLRGLSFAQRKDSDRAFADFTEALRVNPRLTAAYNNRASLSLDKGNVTAALEDVRRTLDIDPDNPFALELRAIISERQGRKDDARIDKERSAKSRLDLGLAESKKGNYDKAIIQYSTAIALKTRYNAPLLYNRGISYEKRGDHAKAVNDYSDAVKLNPRFAEAFLRRGVVLAQKLGDYAGAERDWNTVIQLDPAGKAAQKARENLKKIRDMRNQEIR